MPNAHGNARRAAADDVLVIGAGVVGLSTAVCLAEAGLRVRVDTAHAPLRTTPTAAGANWEPFLVDPFGRTMEWALESLDEFRRLAEDPERTGVRILGGTQQSRFVCDPPAWTRYVEARLCEPSELRPQYRAGWWYRAPVIDVHAYLGHLIDRLLANGGRVRRRVHTSLPRAADLAQVVVNCSGVGARHLVPDASVRPVKGQLVVVENPGLTEFFCDDTPGAENFAYFFPHGSHVTLGGTQELDVWTAAPDMRAARSIVRRCARVEPRLKGARVLGHRAGLRPLRPDVRLCEERVPRGRVLHNYGHGGAGVTLAWGCAREVRDLIVHGAPVRCEPSGLRPPLT